MSYTVHEVAKLSGVTIKTLYHYQKIGLLLPEKIADNGYRYYGDDQLERLQQILFYRELDFSLEQIKNALENMPNRTRCLSEQHALLKARQQRLEAILDTLEKTLSLTKEGAKMSSEKMFHGLNQEEWKDTLSEQNDYLQKEYGFKLDTNEIDAEAMNCKAAEATEFMAFMAAALKNGISANHENVMIAIEKHITFLQKDYPLDAAGFAAQSRFFLSDDFHRGMLEAQQTGLSYYICIAAENYALK
jgi:DNA-binding transcriptional MerR regulator